MSDAAARPKKKILIIDDDVMIRETVRVALQHSGFETVALEAPELAETVMRQSKPDLVLMDLYMGEHSGLDVCRRLKADPTTAGIPIIIFTGSQETIDSIAGFQAGALEYLAKPITADALIAKVRQVLRLS